MTDMSDVYTAAWAMQTYGTNFTRPLGAALIAADPVNAERLAAAFPEIIERYTEVARMQEVA